MAWLDMQWNHPGLTEHYLMQIAMECQRPHLKKGAKVKMKNFVLKFDTGEKPKQMSKEQATAISKSNWLRVVGMVGPKVKTNVKKNPPKSLGS